LIIYEQFVTKCICHKQAESSNWRDAEMRTIDPLLALRSNQPARAKKISLWSIVTDKSERFHLFVAEKLDFLF